MIIYGKQASLYALREHSDIVESIYVNKLSILPTDLLKKYGSKIKTIENKWAQKLSRGGNHQGILVEMSEPLKPSIQELKEGNFLLILDGLTDVGNIGAIIRSAYAFGVDGVIVTGVKQINLSGVIRASSGAALKMPPIVHNNILDLINELKQVGFSIYGANLEGKSLNEASFNHKRVLVLGSEDRGISKRAKERLDNILKINMVREFDSLNVSAAAAIFLHRMSYAIK